MLRVLVTPLPPPSTSAEECREECADLAILVAVVAKKYPFSVQLSSGEFLFYHHVFLQDYFQFSWGSVAES